MSGITVAEPVNANVNQNVISNMRARRVVLLLCAVLVLGAGALVFWPVGGVKVYGRLSPSDLTEILKVHRADCARRMGPGSYQRFCPTSARKLIAGALISIDGIYVQQNGSVIVVYRNALKSGYGSDGRRRWGLAQDILSKGTNGWDFGVPGAGF